MTYEPKSEHRFTFGLWTVGNPGLDPFGEPVREKLSPVQLVELLAEVGAWGVNFHDNDLVPIDASAHERDQIVDDFKKALDETGLVVPMATTNLFRDPVFRDGAYTASDPEGPRLCAAEDDARDRPGRRARRDDLRVLGWTRRRRDRRRQRPAPCARLVRDAINFLCAYVKDQGYDLRFALEPKPNEPRGDIYLPTTGAMLAFIATLDHPEMVGVNPEVAHEHMAGLNFMHHVAQAWSMGKLFHIDLNDQDPGRYDQDFRFGSGNLKHAFFLVKFLEDVRLHGEPALRRARVSHVGLRGREGVRARLHADVPDPQGEGRAVERRPRHPGAGRGRLSR